MRPPSRSLRVVVVRHGPAEVRDPARWPDDRRRPLSRKGTAQTRRSAAGLAGLVGRVSYLAASPAARARRTAEILAEELERAPRPALWPELDVGVLAGPIFGPLRRVAGAHRTIVLVGHEPTLAEFVGLALTGDGVAVARLSKGGAACLEFPSAVRPGAAVLLWLLSRKQLASVRG